MRTLSTSLLIALAIACAHGAAAADDPPVADQSSEEAPPPEEVIVVEQRPLPILRRQLRRLNEDIIDRFNALNDNDELDIVCKKEAPIGSQLKRRVCTTRGQRDGISDATEDLEDTGVDSSPITTPAAYRRRARELNQRILRAAAGDEELLRLLRTRKQVVDRIREQQ